VIDQWLIVSARFVTTELPRASSTEAAACAKYDRPMGLPTGDAPVPAVTKRWLPWISIALLGGALGALIVLQQPTSGDGAPAASTSLAAAASTTLATTTTIATTVPPTTIPTVARTISNGMAGDDVRLVQERLIALKFDPGPVDGVYGLQTRQAIWAFQKLMLAIPREEVSGDVSPELWAELSREWLIAPRNPDLTETQVEVYLPEQVLVVFEGDRPLMITHISSGTGEEWCEEVTIEAGEYRNENGTKALVAKMCGIARTTGGTFKVTRKLQPADDPDGDGWRRGALGEMFRPVYWNYGLAIHGSAKVPNQPDSHGCIRIPMHVAKYFPDLVNKGDSVWVWDGIKVPEAYGAPPPDGDRFVDE
jgi:L,D-transpeptidase catalytic domain/Putative peptidoglycan binding domain